VLLQLGLFGLAAEALAAAGQPALRVAFGVLSVANLRLLLALDDVEPAAR
jgi:hypothetical protein